MVGCGTPWTDKDRGTGWRYYVVPRQELADMTPVNPGKNFPLCGSSDTADPIWQLFCPDCLRRNGIIW